MTANRHSIRVPGLTVRPDRPLIGVVLREDDEEIVHYFADEMDADAAITQLATSGRSLAGAWADLDWDDAVAALDRIRHDNDPTPPIETL